MKDKITTIMFIIFLFSFGLISVFTQDTKFSSFERRKLANFPNKYDENFTDELDSYILDQFAFRNQLIELNSVFKRNILQIKDVNNTYVLDKNIVEILYPLNEEKCYDFCNKINYVISNFDTENIYYSIIPDKSYFISENKYLKLDYNTLYSILNNNINAIYIDITSSLSLDDYYYTDIHWKQQNLEKIIKRIAQDMSFEYIETTYTRINFSNFYGASYSKAGINISPDILTYLSNDVIETCSVEHLEYGTKKIYDEEKLTEIDSYDVFLSGPSSYIKIINPKSKTDKELIIFRDSYASSLAPLLVQYYNKITLIDLRYIDFNFVPYKNNTSNVDILFLYGTQLINNSNLLKVKY